jgi:hypothetical protein
MRPDDFFATNTLALFFSKESVAAAHSLATNARHQASTKRGLPCDEAMSKQMKRARMEWPP